MLGVGLKETMVGGNILVCVIFIRILNFHNKVSYSGANFEVNMFGMFTACPVLLFIIL